MIQFINLLNTKHFVLIVLVRFRFKIQEVGLKHISSTLTVDKM